MKRGKWKCISPSGSHWQLLAPRRFLGSVFRCSDGVMAITENDLDYSPFVDWKEAVKFVEDSVK